MYNGSASTKVPQLVRLYRNADRAVDRALGLARVIHEGVWLGLLNPAERVAVTLTYFSQSEMYRSREHNTTVVYEWERRVFERYFRPGCSVLVAAAGAGREMLALRRMGCQVHGFDCCAELVEASRGLLSEEGMDSQVTLSAPNEVPTNLAHCEAIIIGWCGYHHIPGRARRIGFLKQLRRLVDGGAPMLLSFFTRSDSGRYEKLVWRVARATRFLGGFRAEPVELGDRLMVSTSAHCFEKEEVELELAAGGFRLAYYSDKEYGHAVGIAV
ncbi:class I SAM-dependent methyltransferase [Candidatus Methylomirabilis sp.]|uniref:class I SAM-dependent methyltransferase n=1 Tax=Candidatus Methylomirabilis sp. TaxID=2032687 RepID=UPI002A5C8477|nr:class I SAM-dependent methyltransferase [Candidatus Methylomirabilis sp.]